MSNDEKLKSARGRPEIERGCEDDGLNPKLPPTGPVPEKVTGKVTMPNGYEIVAEWTKPIITAPPAPAPKGLHARQVSMDEPPNPFTNRTWDEPAPQDNPGQPGRISAAPQPGDPAWLVELKDILRGALRASREVMGSGQAYAGISLVMANDEEIEVVWEIGVGRLNATRGETGEGPSYETRDLWGRGGSLEDALTKAHTEKNPRGGRRG